MTFPSDYKVVRFPGTTTGALDVYEGYPRQVLIDTQTWTLRLFDGVTPGGYPVVHLRDFAAIFANPAIVEPGTKLSVEVAANSGAPELVEASNKVRPWSPLVIRSLFEKLANTATAGTWRILDSAMPDQLKLAADPIDDLNEAWYDGFYTVDPSSAANIPGSISTATTRNLALIVCAQSTDNVMQMLVERDNSSKIWIRVRLDGVWQAWVLATGVTSADLATKVSKSGDTMTGPLDMSSQAISRILSINGGPVHGQNECINGDFDFWERAASQTSNGYNSADRWLLSHVGTTKTASKQVNVLGDSAHGAKNFMRHVVSSVAGASNYCFAQQKIEDVTRLAGKRITVTFEAKADSTKDIAIEAYQNFGSGGSPSTAVLGINPQRVTLQNTWQKYSIAFDLPSVTGKILGTDNSDFTGITFWFDAGSTFNARTSNLGQQSGTFDLRHVSFRIGDARSEADPFIARHKAAERILCERFFEKSYDSEVNPGTVTELGTIGLVSSSTTTYFPVRMRTTKRTNPTVVIYAPGTGAAGFTSNGSNVNQAASVLGGNAGQNGFVITSASGTGTGMRAHWTADAEL